MLTRSEALESLPPGAAAWVKGVFAECLGRPAAALPDDEPFFSLGLDSITHGEILARLASAYPDLPSTVLFEHPNFNALGAFLARRGARSEGP